MKVLVTGADGFVGRYLLAALAEAGHEVLPCYRSGGAVPEWVSRDPWKGMHWHPLELGDTASVNWVGAMPCDAVLHLAALASGSAGRKDPGRAWEVNAAGTARFLEVVGTHGRPRTVVVSSGEVYGNGPARPRTEHDTTEPVAPYAASKLGAEIAAGDVARRTGLPVVIARPFARPHLLEVVELAHLGPKDVDDDVADVHDHPVAMGLALDAGLTVPFLLELALDLLGDRAHVAVRSA